MGVGKRVTLRMSLVKIRLNFIPLKVTPVQLVKAELAQPGMKVQDILQEITLRRNKHSGNNFLITPPVYVHQDVKQNHKLDQKVKLKVYQKLDQ